MGAGRRRHQRSRRSGPLRQTNPICPAPVGKGAGRRGRTHLRRRRQSPQTKPMPPGRNEGQVLCGRRVMTNRARKRPRQNKANSRTDSREQGSASLPVPPTGPIVQNKANLPSSRGNGRGLARSSMAAPLGQGVRNKANSRTDRTGHGTARLPGPPVGPIVRNKANSPRAAWRASTLWNKSYNELDLQRASEKQSQFPGSGRREGSGIRHRVPVTPPGPATGECCCFFAVQWVG